MPTAGLKAEVAILIAQRQRHQQERQRSSSAWGLLGALLRSRQWPGRDLLGVRRDGDSFYVMR